MSARILLLLCALTGCDALFRLDELPPADANHAGDGSGDASDAPPGDGMRLIDGSPDASCVAILSLQAADADTELVSNAPSNPFGGYDVVAVASTTHALVRFPLPAGVPYSHYTAMTLNLPYPTAGSMACDSTGQNKCTFGNCAAYDQAGMLLVYPATSGWNEAAATWMLASQMAPWSAPGASGAADRGTTSASAMHVAAQSSSIDLGGAFLQPALTWATGGSTGGGELTLEVVAGDAQVQAEIQSRENTCGGFASPTLQISYCP